MESEYVELATQLKGRFPLLGDRFSAYGTAGPAVAFKASCDWNEVVTIKGVVVNEASASCARAGLGVGDFDFGLSGGTGVEIALSESMGVSVGVAYTLGLLNVATSRTGNFKNRAMDFRFGIVRSIG
jgi:opacity protein-like surface antigen